MARLHRRKHKPKRYDFLNKEYIIESDIDDDLDYYESDDGCYDPDEIEVDSDWE